MDHPIQPRRSDLNIVKENVPNCRFNYSYWPGNKIERKWKAGQIGRPHERFERLWNMKVTVVSFIVVVLGMVTSGWGKKLKEWKRIKTIPMTALLKTAGILRRML